MTRSSPRLFTISFLTTLLLGPLVVFAGEVAPEEVVVPVMYTAPADGFVSLALYNDRGQLVRSLLSAKPVKAGAGTVIWDGTSDFGIPQSAGNYSTKAIFFKEPPKAEYVMTVGKSGNPPYRTPDGKGDWGGNLRWWRPFVRTPRASALQRRIALLHRGRERKP